MAYSDVEVSEALIKLAINKGDYDLTAEQTGVSLRTLKRWAKMTPKKGVPELLERAIERMLMVIPTEWKGNQWAIALGILMDKWLLAQGMPTARMENIITRLRELHPDEYGDVIAEAERILAAASGGGADSVPGE
jgi:hypothetical protein